MNVEIRDKTEADVSEIEALTTAAFLNAPHTSRTEQYIVNALRDAGTLTISLVAETKGTLVGHIAVSPVFISDGTSGWFGLGPLSVLPEHQHSGVGTCLMHEALRILRERGEPRYYSRFGFRVNPNLALPDVPPEYFQAISFGSSRPKGIVSYHGAFHASGRG
jgi:putative acetyltransferase